VTRHVQALAQELHADGHYVRVLAPFDSPGWFTSLVHRGAAPQRLTAPEYLVALGRTVGVKANGAVSNLSIAPGAVSAMLNELRVGRYDVVHIHEPVAPAIGWFAADRARLPLVGTFHAYSDRPLPNGVANLLGARRVLGRLHVRIAVSKAAAWTGRRWFGGDYRIIPNGVHVDRERAARTGQTGVGERLRIVFVDQPVERKGLPVLLRAFEALRDQIPAELVLVGPSSEQLARLMRNPGGVRALGTLDDDSKRRELELADVLCAPAVGGESFGMVLTEAFAAGTPAVASDIVGYREVVRDGVDGVLVPPGDPQALAAALLVLWAQPEQRARMGHVAAADVQRFAWRPIAAQVLDAYREAIAIWTGSRGAPVWGHGSACRCWRSAGRTNHTTDAGTAHPVRRKGARLSMTVKTGSRCHAPPYLRPSAPSTFPEGQSGGVTMTDRMTEAGRRRLELGSDPGELIDRIVKLRALLPAFAQETAVARREAARLRSQDATLQRRIVELESRSAVTRDLTP
jgi:phosphatidylinositol alpha-mannosyltransferase